MALGNPVNVRLSVEKQLQYEAEAAGQGVPLGTYLRQRLEAADDVLHELATLRRAVERVATAAQPAVPSAPTSAEFGVQLEMLLLLRQIAQAQKTQIAQQELKRLGIEVWDGQARRA